MLSRYERRQAGRQAGAGKLCKFFADVQRNSNQAQQRIKRCALSVEQTGGKRVKTICILYSSSEP